MPSRSTAGRTPEEETLPGAHESSWPFSTCDRSGLGGEVGRPPCGLGED